MRLAARDLERVRDIAECLRTWTEGEPALAEQLSQIRELLDADRAAAFGLAPRGEGVEVAFGYEHHVHPRLFAMLDDFLRDRPAGWGSYDPLRPEPVHRNRPLLASELVRIDPEYERLPMVRQFYPRASLDGCDQVRVIVCESASLLAWMGFWRSGSFRMREKVLLRSLTPALQRRLLLERRLNGRGHVEAALAAALESIPAAAFIVRPSLTVLDANAVGRHLLERDRKDVLEQVARAVRNRPSRFDLTKLSVRGSPDCYLAVAKPDAAVNARDRSAAAACRWRLTPRQGEVLQQVMEGRSNRAIAAILGIAEATVELHVSALLDRAQCESRSQLIARVWGE